ncbi:DUF559 domain-containing protein [Sphingobacteriales bacterium UPWRP_1]|nr:hypothetical protein BVG80_10760 [Sphingobacteriales bacterium TSM_CSM]PSJ77402.1 DUF559 domain-containing protein [Sphingobacteriales bacterium UPWRP_1]
MYPPDPHLTLFANAPPWLFRFAKTLRANPTPAEALLWTHLSNKQCCGLKFRRQHPLLYFIADFYCFEIRLVVEIDEAIHQVKEQYQYDAERTRELEQAGIMVMRFTNETVLTEVKTVVSAITQLAQNRLPLPP